MSKKWENIVKIRNVWLSLLVHVFMTTWQACGTCLSCSSYDLRVSLLYVCLLYVSRSYNWVKIVWLGLQIDWADRISLLFSLEQALELLTKTSLLAIFPRQTFPILHLSLEISQTVLQLGFVRCQALYLNLKLGALHAKRIQHLIFAVQLNSQLIRLHVQCRSLKLRVN